MIITIKIPLPNIPKLKRREPRRGQMVNVACVHCGRTYQVAMKYIRVGNYCGIC